MFSGVLLVEVLLISTFPPLNTLNNNSNKGQEMSFIKSFILHSLFFFVSLLLLHIVVQHTSLVGNPFKSNIDIIFGYLVFTTCMTAFDYFFLKKWLQKGNKDSK